jgi:hypothetical protein
MIIIGVLLNVVGLGVFCWAVFALAIQALPFCIGVTAGIYVYQTRAGPLGARHHRLCCGWFHTRARAVRLLRRAPAHCPPPHWPRFRRLALGTMGPRHCAIRYSPGMVAGVVRHAWRRRRRVHCLGTRVDLDRACSQTGRCVWSSPAADWGDDPRAGDSTGLSAGISADVGSSNMTATSRSSPTFRLGRRISSGGDDPVARSVVVGPLCAPTHGHLSLRQASFSFARNAVLLA